MSNDEELKRLLALIEASGGYDGKAEVNDVEAFIIAKNVRVGNDKIMPGITWLAYKEWSKNPVSRKKFENEFSKHFRAYMSHRQRFFKLDASSFDLSEENIWKVRAEQRDRHILLKEKRRGSKERNEAKAEYLEKRAEDDKEDQG